jgi:hypothetical protein
MFFSCLTILLILLLLEEMHAATLHGTTRRNNDIHILKGVCRVKNHKGILLVFQITFTSLVLIFKFYFFSCYFTLYYLTRCTQQRCTGPLVYTTKSGVLFVCLFVCDARHAFCDRRSERGVRGVHGKSSTGRGAQCRFRGVLGHGRRDTEFQSIYGPENGQKMEKMAEIRKFQKNHTISTP